MADREKVIKGIETCRPSVFARKCSDCPYKDEMNCDYVLWHDVIDMLKEQPKECKSCGTIFDIAYKAGKESIVRCKDCKWVAPDMVCGHPNETLNPLARNDGKPYFYCYDGEAKT